MERTYLFVPPEEAAEVRALGAGWDDKSMRWYIGVQEDPARFSRWLPGAEEEVDEEADGFTIASEEAYVAAATTTCWKCNSKIEVICIYCESGIVLGEELTGFTVSHLRAMDAGLARQLAPWPGFRRLDDSDKEGSGFANHCSHCGAPQDDFYLHSEPDHPFFSIPRAAADSVKLTPIIGRVQLSGDESFET